MLVGRGWAFIHIPKCGGMAIRQQLTGREIGEFLPLGSSCAIRSPFHRIPKKRPNGRVFSIVRNPADWLRSFWLDQAPDRIGKERYLHQYWSDDLNQFVVNVCEGRPGYVTALYNAHLSFHTIKVFRLENGLDAVMHWLGLNGRRVPVHNASPAGPQLDDDVRALVEKSERVAMRRFRYL